MRCDSVGKFQIPTRLAWQNLIWDDQCICLLERAPHVLSFIYWFKLNSDGTSLGNPREAGGGGSICDSQGNSVKGYMRHIGVATSIYCWILGSKGWFLLVSQLGISHLVVELDTKIVVDLVLSKSISNGAYSSLLNDCGFLLENFQ